ncbi:hypothetical protein GQ53DRAFT_8145 [Thozetella sp. PMI_491]|nr:hypothetical protein GQ53DRAFT_8145 [Thozetella sp. PMI_491]
MFEVIWEDPNKQTVGEHKRRKELRRPNSGRRDTSTSSLETRATEIQPSSSNDVPLFSAKRDLTVGTQRVISNKPAPLLLSLSQQGPETSCTSSTKTRASSSFESTNSLTSLILATAPGSPSEKSTHSSSSQSLICVTKFPTFVQPLGDSSFVSRSIEARIESKGWSTAESNAYGISVTEITARGLKPQTSMLPTLWYHPQTWNDIPPPVGKAKCDAELHVPATAPKDCIEPDTLSLMSISRCECESMTEAPALLVLSRLQENWSHLVGRSSPDEIHMMKHRWMLAALHARRRKAPRWDAVDHPTGFQAGTPRTQMVVAAYESPGTTSYVAGLHPCGIIYHLSPSPLTSPIFPNIRPIICSGVSRNVLQVAAGVIDVVYAQSICSSLPAVDIPAFLFNVKQMLAPGGVLRMTLVDPLPSAEMLGPRMRAWLDSHLIIELERQFRCVNPGRLLPSWLKEASLSCDESITEMIKLPVVAPSPRGSKNVEDGAIEAEVCSLIGRMLWEDIWGAFLTTDARWWNNDECVKECENLGTYWECKFIEATKVASS